MLLGGSYSVAMVDITRVGVIGSGIMGAGLAEVAACAGFDVVVRSRSRRSADDVVATIDKRLVRSIERGTLTQDEREVILARIIMSWFPVEPGPALDGVNGFLSAVTEPVLGPLRRALPPVRLGAMALDLSPIIVIIGLQVLQAIICG